MKANELRIGNYVNCEYEGLMIIRGVLENSVNLSKTTKKGNTLVATYPISYIKSIPLTENWLLDFGFEKVQHILGVSGFKSYGYEKGIISVYLIKDGFEIEYYAINEYFNLAKTFKHVHQLQNLYFALTGNELNNNMEKLTKTEMKHIRSKSDQKTELTEIIEKAKCNFKRIDKVSRK